MTTPEPAIPLKACGCPETDDCDCAELAAELADALAWPALVASMISRRRIGWS